MNGSDSKVTKKGSRKFLVCTACRKRKIKCDRKRPCSHCLKAGLDCEFKAPNGEPIVVTAGHGVDIEGNGLKISAERRGEGEMEEVELAGRLHMGTSGSLFARLNQLDTAVSMVGTTIDSTDQWSVMDVREDVGSGRRWSGNGHSGGNSRSDDTRLTQLIGPGLAELSVDSAGSTQGLRMQVDELRRKLTLISARVDAQGDPAYRPSVLDIKLPSLKRFGVHAKPSSTIFLGPTSIFTGSSITMINSLFSSMKNTLNQERRAWKQLHHIHERAVNFTGDAIDEDIAVGLIRQLVCPNYYAFQERLFYFQNHLNHILYSNFVPMDIVQTLFLTSFRQPDQSGVAQFSRPRKCFLYADVALILSIVYLVVIFTRYNGHNNVFTHSLLVKPEDLSSLALKVLSLSEYRRKKTQLALLSLIVLRSALFVHDNYEGANELVNSYPVFQSCLVLCYQMGIHFPGSSSPDSLASYLSKDKLTMKSRAMTPDQVQDLWNYIQQEDAIYSVSMGTPLLINYHFSSPFNRKHDNWIENTRADGIMLLRDISLTVNSTESITMRDVLKLIDKVIAYCHQLPFKLFTTSSSMNLDGLAILFRLKLLLLQTLQCLCRMEINAVSDLCSKNTALNLDALCEEMYRESLLAAAAVLYSIRDLFGGLTVFGNEKDGKYIIFLRDILSQGILVAFMVWFSYVICKATKNTDIIIENGGSLLCDYPPEATFEEEVNVYTIEEGLYHRHTGKDIGFCERLSYKLVSTSTLITFSPPLYDIVSQNMVMRNSLDSFMTLKLVIMWLYVLQTVQECEREVGGRKMNVADIISRTKEKVESSFNLGRLDESLKLNTDEYELERVFDSLFNGEMWS